jgi:hypothetical protein
MVTLLEISVDGSIPTIGQVEFPVGNFNSANSAILNFTQSPKQGGAITYNLGVGNVNKMGLPMSDGGDNV